MFWSARGSGGAEGDEEEEEEEERGQAGAGGGCGPSPLPQAPRQGHGMQFYKLHRVQCCRSTWGIGKSEDRWQKNTPPPLLHPAGLRSPLPRLRCWNGGGPYPSNPPVDRVWTYRRAQRGPPAPSPFPAWPSPPPSLPSYYSPETLILSSTYLSLSISRVSSP